MIEKMKQVVREYAEKHLDVTDGNQEFEVYVVWSCKTLQNWKALVSTDVINGVYWEVTHNGDKNETYVDTYTKSSNVCVKGE